LPNGDPHGGRDHAAAAEDDLSEQAFDPRIELAEWLHGERVREYAGETEAWATERVARVMARLNAERLDAEPKEAVILLLPRSRAFTTTGRYVYISRRLLERLPSDDEAAFVLAHEIAHHDCGHLALYRRERVIAYLRKKQAQNASPGAD
jgi:Zn-dependent protease with chaperone function